MRPLLGPAGWGFTQLSQHAVLDPVRIPPFHRRDRVALKEHGEVQVIAAGQTGLAAQADLLIALDLRPRATSIDDRCP